MKDNFQDESKNGWHRLVKQKWFFPTLYLAIAALLLIAVIWYQTIENNLSDGADPDELVDNYTGDMFDEEAEAVLQQKEIIKMPIQDEVHAEIVTKFYDYDGEKEEQESGLILYNNRYYQSTGVGIATAEGEEFDVIAALSGTIEEVKEDPLLGNVITVSHDNDIKTFYSSLSEISVKAGDEVKQGDVVGVAGKSLFNQDSGTHVHFEIRKDDVEVNPEQFFNEPVSLLEQFDVDEVMTKEESDPLEDDEDDKEDDSEESDAMEEDTELEDDEEKDEPEEE